MHKLLGNFLHDARWRDECPRSTKVRLFGLRMHSTARETKSEDIVSGIYLAVPMMASFLHHLAFSC